MTTDKPSPVAGPASEPAPLHHIINMRWAYEQACDLADWANANGTTLGNDEKLYQAAIKLRDTLGKATHAAQPVPAPAVDERTLLIDGQTPHQFALSELHAFQEATGCDTAEQFVHLAAASNAGHGGAAIWRCFHCDELFADRQAANDHFGESEHDRPFCQMDANYIRWLLAQHRRNVDDDSEALRTVRSLASQHEELRRRAEELGYARGLADAKRHPEELGLVADRSAATSPDAPAK